MDLDTSLLLIDGKNLLARNYAVLKDLRTSQDWALGGLFGFVKGLIGVIWALPEYTPVVVWDGGRSGWRQELLPGYKEGRKKVDEDEEGLPGFVSVAEQIKMADYACRALGVRTACLPGVEADDVIGVLSRASQESVVYSSDRDFFQLIRPGHSVYRPDQKADEGYTLIRAGEFKDHVSVRVGKRRISIGGPWLYRAAHAMAGDPGDKIPGVRGVGWAKALKICRAALRRSPESLDPEGGDLEGIRTVCAESHLKIWQRVDEEWDQYLLCMELIDLWKDDLLDAAQIQSLSSQLADWPAFNTEQVIKTFQVWEFTELLRDFGFLQRALSQARGYVDVEALEFSFAGV